MNEPTNVTISEKRYKQLIESEKFLNCLEACGVDNWDGYGDAWEMMEGDE